MSLLKTYCCVLFLSGRLPCCPCTSCPTAQLLVFLLLQPFSPATIYSSNVAAFVAPMANARRMTHIPHAPGGGEKGFSLQISGSPFQMPSGMFSEAERGSGIGGMQHASAFCGAGSVGRIYLSGFLSQQ